MILKFVDAIVRRLYTKKSGKIPERLDILNDNALEFVKKDHLLRYNYARSFVEDKTVLDIGCGYGYGAYVLSKKAKYVLGIDISENAIEYARKNYFRENIEFSVLSALECNKLNKTFDIITIFEVFEHLSEKEQVMLLRNLKQVCHKNTEIFISTPNKKYSLVERGLAINPHHKHELFYEDFIKMLKEHGYSIIEIIGEMYYIFSYIPYFWRIFSALKLSDFVLKTGRRKPQKAFTIIVRCKYDKTSC